MKKSTRIAFWATTSFFALWMLFTAYAQLALPQVRQMFTHLGLPDYFRVELSVGKIVGVIVLLAPAPTRLKEWAYACFALTLSSALNAHLSVGDGPVVYLWPVAAGIVLAFSYSFYRKVNSYQEFLEVARSS